MAENTTPTGGWSQIYNSIFEQSIMGIVLCDLEGAILECNPAFCHMVGYTQDELQHKTVMQLTHPEDWALESKRFPGSSLTMPAGSNFSTEKRYLHKDGRIVWAKINATAIRGTHNKPVFGFAIVEDITAQKLATDSLRSSEARYRSLFSEMTSGFALHEIILDADGHPRDYRFLDVNPAFEALTGLHRNTILGKTVREVIPAIEPSWIARYGAVALTGTPASFEDHAVALQKHFSVHAYSPKSGQFAVIFTDITELTQARDQLATEKERLNVTLRSISDGVVAADTAGNVILVNPVVETWLAQSQQDLIGRPVSTILPLVEAASLHPCAPAIEKAMNEKQPYESRVPLRLMAGDNSNLRVTVTGKPICNSSSSPIGMVFVLRNVTEILRVQEERIRTEKLESLGHLAAGLAHDFNNLLTTLLGNVSLVRSHPQTAPEILPMLTDAEESVQKAGLLTQQLLTFAEGGAPIKAEIDVGTLVKEAAEFALHGTTSRLDLRLPGSLWKSAADPQQLAQAIRNLIVNANQAMPGGGTIHIAAENLLLEDDSPVPLPPGPYLKIAITDSGVGIPERHLTKIFDPYFTTKQHSSGMGLATTLSIINNHAGHITVHSRLGIGTTFDLFLPAITTASSSLPTARIPKNTGGCTRVLIMDDEEAIRNLATRILTRNGCGITAVSTGEEALAAYDSARSSDHPFDVVILDLTIRGGMGGKDTIQRLREIDPAVKAIVSSGYSNDPVLSNYRKYGFRSIVPKPYQAETLIRAVAELTHTPTGA